MSDDDIFRWIMIGGLVAVLPVAVYHRWRSMTSEKLDRRQEGLLILFLLRPLGIVGMLGIITYLIDPAWMVWSSVPLPTWVRWVGVAPGTLAGLLLVWTFHNLGRNITDTVVTRKEHSLVMTGPYRWVRHPFYVSFALAMLANSLVTANWFIFVVGIVAFLLLVVRTKKEEEKLIERFGDEYRRYMETTGRFWPRLSVRRIQANDCRTLPFDVKTVYAALIDFENYPKWWPADLRLRVLVTTADLVGSRFEVQPTGGSFVCEVAQGVTEKKLVIHYVDGLHRGTGVWTMEPATNGTKLCYRIDLEPQGWLPRFLSHFMDFAIMHSRGMETLFDGLEAWLRGKKQ